MQPGVRALAIEKVCPIIAQTAYLKGKAMGKGAGEREGHRGRAKGKSKGERQRGKAT